jgi:outer membrane protein assembly factor BamD
MKVQRNFGVLFGLSAWLLSAGCSAHKPAQAVQTGNSAEPDKVLYERATNDIKHGRYEVGRLALQTLINTYPDSDYLAKAKLGIADAYFKEGGTANLTQAIASYKDFIVFFPFMQEAAYAQMQVAMTHYRQMDKPDRDRAEGQAAEEEFQTFLQKYPDSPLAPQAEQHLRDVQEMLADGDFRVGYYYYVKGTPSSYRASFSRLSDVVNRYPLYSKSDQALWMMGNMIEKSSKGEQKKAAAPYYARIVRNYPLSNLASQAKERLAALHAPIPQPDPQALAWMEKERAVDRGHAGLFHKATGILRNGPDVRSAARSGAPTMTPASETASGGDILRPEGTSAVGAGAGNTAVIETVTPGSSSGTSSEASPPSSNAPARNASSDSGTSSAPTPEAASSGSSSSSTSDPGSPNSASPSSGASSTAGSNSAGGAAGDSSQTSGQQSNAPQGDQNTGKQQESSSKKKKGLHKVIPW